MQSMRYRRVRQHRLLAHQEAFTQRVHCSCYSTQLGYVLHILLKSLLIKFLTQNHAIIIYLVWWTTDDVSKVSLLKSFPGAEARLLLFKADIYKPNEFENAIKCCQYVFHVATPLLHTEGSQVLQFLFLFFLGP